MKQLSILLSILFLAAAAHAQNNIPVTTNGIADIKLDMTRAQLEKLLGQKLNIPNHPATDYAAPDTTHFNYKGVDMEVVFQKMDPSETQTPAVVTEISSSNSLLHTKSGIGIGDDKCKIVTTYDLYDLYIVPGYENNKAVKTKCSIRLRAENASGEIIFYCTDNKVSRIGIITIGIEE